MEIQEISRVVGQRWRVIAITTLFCVSLALSWSLAGPVTYRAQGRMMIATYGSLSTAVDAFSGERVSQLRAPTYAQLMEGQEVAARTADALGDRFTSELVQKSLNAQISAAMPMLEVSATAPTADDAVRILAAAEQVFKQYIAQIEEPGRDGSLTGVRLTNDPPAVSRVGSPTRNAVLSGLFGLFLGAMLALYRDRTDQVIRNPSQIARTGAPYRGTIDVQRGCVTGPGGAFRALAVGCTANNATTLSRILISGVDRISGAAAPALAMGLAGGFASYGDTVTVGSAVPQRDCLEWPDVDEVWSSIQPGLSDVIAGASLWEDCAVSSRINNVSKIGAGTRAQDIDALLMARSQSRAANALNSSADRTVLIGPPLTSPIAVAVATTVDCCLLVVTFKESLQSEMIEAILALEALGVHLLGVVAVREKRISRRSSDRRTDQRPHPNLEDELEVPAEPRVDDTSKVPAS